MTNMIAIIVSLIIAITPVTEIKTVAGKFTGELTTLDGKQHYQFKSHDNMVWWFLTEDKIGFAPSTDKEYVLLYSDNGTTKENKPCDCAPELECECEVYDDVFVKIYEEEQK